MSVCFSVPLDLDVRMKAVLIGALFLIVSALLHSWSEEIYWESAYASAFPDYCVIYTLATC